MNDLSLRQLIKHLAAIEAEHGDVPVIVQTETSTYSDLLLQDIRPEQMAGGVHLVIEVIDVP